MEHNTSMGRIVMTMTMMLLLMMVTVVVVVVVADAGGGGGGRAFADKSLETLRRRQNLLANGLADTPPMGWNSWNHFSCNINESTIRETADALVSTGLAKLGYKYVNIDDCWAELTRDQKGNLVPRKSTFPSGIKALADYVHSKGLKLGIYSDSGE